MEDLFEYLCDVWEYTDRSDATYFRIGVGVLLAEAYELRILPVLGDPDEASTE